MAVRFAEFLVRFRTLLLLSHVLLIAFIGSGLAHLRLDSGIEIFFAENDPNLLAQKAIEARYGTPDNLLFVVSWEPVSRLTREKLAAIEEITDAAWQLPYSRRVDSVSNYQYPSVDGDDISIAPPLEGAAALTPAEFDAGVGVLLSDPLATGRIIAASGDVVGINVSLQVRDDGKAAQVNEVVLAARRIASDIEQRYSGVRVQLAGTAITEQSLAEVTASDGAKLGPVLAIVMSLMLFYLLRSAWAPLLTLVCIILSVIVGMGTAGWAGLGLNSVTISAPTIIMTLAIADCVHVLNAFKSGLAEGMERQAALTQALAETAWPVALTSITTTGGFLSLLFSDSPVFGDLGLMAAAGVMGALLVTYTVLPFLVMQIPHKKSAITHSQHMAALARFIISRAKTVLLISGSTVIVLAGLATQLTLNDDPTTYFSSRTAIAQALTTVENRLSGTQSIEWNFDAEQENGALTPEFLQQTAAFSAWLRQQPEVANVDVFTDTLMRLNQVLHNDDPSWYVVPDDAAMASQYTLLYEMSVPYGLDPGNLITPDRSAIRLQATLRNQKSQGLLQFEERARLWMDLHAPGIATRGASESLSFARIGLRNIESMLWGALMAIVLISASLVLALRSFRWGLVSLLPNLLPAVSALGIWSVINGEVNIAASVVFSLTLGIVVDDTTHFLVRYLHYRRQAGMASPEAIIETFRSVGTALVTTSLVLSAGFLTLLGSDFLVNATTGALVAITIMMAIVLDLTLLPALVLWIDRDRHSWQHRGASQSNATQ